MLTVMQTVLGNWLAGSVLHDGELGPEQYRQCSDSRNARRLGLGGQPVWHGHNAAVSSFVILGLKPFESPL